MQHDETVWVGLPAYNEADAIIPLLRRFEPVREQFLRQGRSLQVLVVNDGSRDATPERVEAYRASHPHVTLINHGQNRGLGAGINTILLTAAERGRPGDCLVIMDADNTHDPANLPGMVETLKARRAGVVIASRFVPGARERGVAPSRRLFSWGAGLLYHLVFPVRGVRDYTSGFRAYDLELIQQALAGGGPLVHSCGFEATTELLLRLCRLGALAAEYPIDLAYDRKAGASKMAVVKTIRGHLALISRMLLANQRQRLGP